MESAELDRQFEQPSSDVDDYNYLRGSLGYYKSRSWDNLLKERLVVILASASSGKTHEFQAQANKLVKNGETAVFIAIEDLANEDLDFVLSDSELKLLETWRQTTEIGYFFLDSVDEAKLGKKSDYRKALKKLRKFLGDDIYHAHIYISSRPSDWKKDVDDKVTLTIFGNSINENDASLIEEIPEDSQKHAKIKSVIFGERKSSATPYSDSEPEPDLLVLSLLPLDLARQRTLAVESGGVSDIDAFSKAIRDNGLEAYARRPGDLLELAAYWDTHKAFATYAKMTDFGIKRLLREKSELDEKTHLTDEKIRQGVERLAVALLLTKRLSILKEGSIPESNEDSPVNPQEILPDWSSAEREVLLRRGIFAPASFSAVRFQHRSTIEYLAACWFKARLKSEKFKDDAFKLLFRTSFGVETLSVEFRAVVGWLALEDSAIRDKVIETEPFELIRHGDPKSLPIHIRKTLLRRYAEASLNGDVSNEDIEHRAVWSFADTELADTIRECWKINDEWSFRRFLIDIICEGEIHACADLVKAQAWGKTSSAGFQVVAIECLKKLGKISEVQKIADGFVDGSFKYQSDYSSDTYVALRLYPQFLKTEKLIEVIRRAKKPERYDTGNYGYNLPNFAQQCPLSELDGFLISVTDLAYSRPHKSTYKTVSKRFGYLSRHFEQTARVALDRLAEPSKSKGLARILLGQSISDQSSTFGRDNEPLFKIINSDRELKRQVFLEEVRFKRAVNIEQSKDYHTHPHRMFLNGLNTQSYVLDAVDIDWLLCLANDCSLDSDDRIAAYFSALQIMRRDGSVEDHRALLTEIAKLSTSCQKWLASALKPSKVDKRILKMDRKRRKADAMRSVKQNEDAQSWIDYKNDLLANLPKTEFSNGISNESFNFMRHLTRYLEFVSRVEEETAYLGWRSLIPVFGEAIATRYFEHMTQLWRHTKPRRPKWNGNSCSRQWLNIWSLAGIGIEAKADVEWAKSLSDDEAVLASRHLFRSDTGIADWMDDLLDAHPVIAFECFRAELKHEWTLTQENPKQLISHLKYHQNEISPKMADTLVSVILNNEAGHIERWKDAASILNRLNLDTRVRKQLFDISRKNLKRNDLPDRFDTVFLGLMLVTHSQEGLSALKKYLVGKNKAQKERIIGALFAKNMSNDSILHQLSLSASQLLELLELCYKHVKVKDDIPHKSGGREINTRTNAEDARGSVLTTLLAHNSESAYNAVRQFAKRKDIASNETWFKILSKRMVEGSLKFAPWTSTQVYTFISEGELPIQTPDQFFDLVVAALNNIQRDLLDEDFSMKDTVHELKTEKKVQEWLGVRLREKLGRHASQIKELNVADSNRADINVIARGIEAEVIIELKHSDKGWTIEGFEKAISEQIVKKYLRVDRRKHGILFISHHNKKYWKDPKTKKRIFFPQIIERLSKHAKKVVSVSTKPIQVIVIGLITK